MAKVSYKPRVVVVFDGPYRDEAAVSRLINPVPGGGTSEEVSTSPNESAVFKVRD
jgi:hypothetical protein